MDCGVWGGVLGFTCRNACDGSVRKAVPAGAEQITDIERGSRANRTRLID